MKKFIFAICLIVGMLGLIPHAHAEIGFPYGSNCTGGCGIGTGIITSTIKCQLYDTNPNNPPYDCPTSQADYSNAYYANLPKTIDPTKFWMSACSIMPTTMGYVLGAELGNSDRTFWDAASPTGPFNVATCHKILVEHTVPASSSGNGAGPVTGYLTANPNGTANNPLSNYDVALINYPGPLAYLGGSNGLFQIATPNPPASFPLIWEGTTVGAMTATRGYPTTIPINILWKNANATSVAGLGACIVGQLGSVYQVGGHAAANAANWYVGKIVNGTCTWTHMSTLPVFVATTLQISQNGITYPCPGSANGGVNPVTKQPKDLCTATNGSTLNTSVTPFYTGIWSGNPNEDYREIGYNPLGYYMDTNGASPPSNAVPTAALYYFPATTAPLGTVNGTATFTTYTDSSLTQIATGTLPFTVNFTINVTDETPVVENRPTSPSIDATLPAFYRTNATDGIYQCSNLTGGYGPSYWNDTLSTYMWGPFSPTNFGEVEYWNYDGAAAYQSISDMLMQNGNNPWPDWTPNTLYGDKKADMAIKPITDPNGNIWLAYTMGTSGTTRPTFPANAKPGTIVVDGTGGLQWIDVATQVYWNSCVVNSGTEYMNNVLLTNGAVGQFTNFAKSLSRNAYRTNNSVEKDGTVVTGLYTQAANEMVGAGVGVGVFSPFSPNAGRGDAYPLMTDATYYQRLIDSNNVAELTNNAALMRTIFYQQNNTFAFWNIHENQNLYSPDDTKTFAPTLDPMHIGTGIEGALELWATCQRDNNNSHNVCDPRIIPEVKKIADFIYMNWYDQCFKHGGPHCWGMSYNPIDFQNATILEPRFTELMGPVYPVYDFLYAFCGNDPVACSAPDGTPYDVIADEIRMHSYDGRANCTNLSCGTYAIPWAGGAGSPKIFGQICKYGCGVSENLRQGGDPTIDDMAPQSNPCWDTRTVPCPAGTLHPYAATKADYMVQLNTSGAQSDPTCENHSVGLACSPLQDLGSNSVTVQFNTYGRPNRAWVNYGTTTACNEGTISTEPAGFPKQNPNVTNTEFLLHNFNITTLNGSTHYQFQLCTTSAAGVTACNNCGQTQGNFLGGNINATTLPSGSQVKVITTSIPNADKGEPYSATLQAQGGLAPYNWLPLSSLPAGLQLTTAGIVHGTPTVFGTFSFIVRACDSSIPAQCGNGTVQIIINNVPPLHITNTTLPNAYYKLFYNSSIDVTGGYPPYSFSILNGKLPQGLSLNPNTGAIQGYPSPNNTVHQFTFTVQVKDSHSQTVQQTYTITVSVKSST